MAFSRSTYTYDGYGRVATTTTDEVVFLAPLDPVSARGRAKVLFDFDYVWEVYKPADKRKYGYYTLPILWGDRLVGGFDSKLDRTTNTFVILGFWLEDEALGTDETFATGIVINDSTLTDTSKTMAGLANSTKYYWRVNAKNNAGTGVYSATWAFTTIVANPSIPSLVGPADGATNQDLSVKYVWLKIAGATSYRLQVASDSTFASGVVVNDSTVTDSTKTVGGLAFGMKYFWRVNSKNIGGTSPYSSIWNFRTYDSDPAIPKQLAPANLATGLLTPLTITFTRPSGATSFHLQVSTDSTFSGAFVVNDATLADTFKTVVALNYVTTYYWRVNADAVSGTSPYSPVRRFTTGIPAAAAPLLVFPLDQYRQATDSLRVIWRTSTPAVDRYWVALSLDTRIV